MRNWIVYVNVKQVNQCDEVNGRYYLTANGHGHEDHGAIEAPLWLWRKP